MECGLKFYVRTGYDGWWASGSALLQVLDMGASSDYLGEYCHVVRVHGHLRLHICPFALDVQDVLHPGMPM